MHVRGGAVLAEGAVDVEAVLQHAAERQHRLRVLRMKLVRPLERGCCARRVTCTAAIPKRSAQNQTPQSHPDAREHPGMTHPGAG